MKGRDVHLALRVGGRVDPIIAGTNKLAPVADRIHALARIEIGVR